MELFHFTSIAKLPAILRSQRLQLSESGISEKRPMAGPPVVWLTKNGDPAAEAHGIHHDPVNQKLHDYHLIDKTRIRFTVELPNVRVTRWADWARSHGIDRAYLSRVMSIKGAFSWYVCERPITIESWIMVEDVQADKVIWLAGPRPERHLSAAERA